ncbi:hypothetical protein ScPMuIL_018765 [Solemya velum]
MLVPPLRMAPVNVWDTSKNHDRILQQMQFQPIGIDISRPKVILVDNSIAQWSVKEGKATFIEHECLVQNCIISDSVGENKHVDARLFDQNVLFSDDSLRKSLPKRTKDQVWIFFSLESPFATPKYAPIARLFNWTATYRQDSTIVAPYEKWATQTNTPLKTSSKNYASGKTKQIAMFVSNCHAFNERLEYARELSEFITVDIFGNCGGLKCRRGSKECHDMLKRDYKFYLSFENANCRHYITEKFFVNALQNDIIPIVMGAHPDDYKTSAPPNSYIHVDDFESPKELAKYLEELDRDDDKYNKYFEWKDTGDFINTKFWCRLCAMVNDAMKPTLVVNNLEQWWRGENICLPEGFDRKWINV